MHSRALTYAGLAVAVLAISNSAVTAQETEHHLAARAELANEAADIQKEFGQSVDVSLDGYDHELVARSVAENADDNPEETDGIVVEENDEVEDEDEEADEEAELVQRDVTEEDDDDSELPADVDYSLEGYNHKLVARNRGANPDTDLIDYSLEGYDHELIARQVVPIEDEGDEEDEGEDAEESDGTLDSDLRVRDAAALDNGVLAGAVPKNILKKLGRMMPHHVQAKRSEDEDDDSADLAARDAALPARLRKKLQRLKPHHAARYQRIHHAKRTADDPFKEQYVAESGDQETEVDDDDDFDYETQDEPTGYDHSTLEQQASTEGKDDDKVDLVTRSVTSGEDEDFTEEKSWLDVKRWF
ncbi:unnamed protein product [Zymoseptoria tritici ST99CH_1A5]|uniref:Uncharacterized protein n=1 Tax=Zymoseptoria tritici ST99CH_1A5 TaxID=1276529 RepID=A0A1Y6L6Y8_ZYMTR|nr:unnamed protein product [Zymoseptoria tritici ST99CH_1A5]